MHSIEHHFDGDIRRGLVAEDSEGLFRPEDLPAGNVPAEAAGAAELLCLGEISLAAPQFLVGCSELCSPLRNPLIELGGGPLLFAQQPSLLQPHDGQVCCNAQDKSLGLSREVGTPGPSHHDSHFALQSQPQGCDRHVPFAGWAPDGSGPCRGVLCHPATQNVGDLLLPGSQVLRSGDPNHLDGRRAELIFQPDVDEVEAQHPQQGFEQSANNLGCVAAMPEGRKGEEADEIVDAALKPLDLLSRIFGRGFHLSQLREATLLYLVRRPRNSRRNSPGGTKNGFC